MVLEIHAELVGPHHVLLSLKHSGIRLFDNDVKSSKYIIRHTHIHKYSMVGIRHTHVHKYSMVGIRHTHVHKYSMVGIRHTHIHIYSMVGIYLFMCNCALCLGA